MSAIDLDEQATQGKFSLLVGVSQQAIGKQVDNGVLTRGESFGDWLIDYTNHLREEAAGRGGSQQQSLTVARTEEATVKAALGRVSYHEKIGTIVSVDDAKDFLSDWAGYANREYRSGTERLILDVEAVFSINVEKELVDKHAGSAINRVKRYAEKLGASGGSSGEDVPDSESYQDERMD